MDKIGIKQYCEFLKGYIIPETPHDFSGKISESFRFGLTDGELDAGIAAFRKMLYKLFDRAALLSGDEPSIKKDVKKKYDKDDYRRYTDVIHHLAWILYRMGQAELETKPNIRLVGKIENYYLVWNNDGYILDDKHREGYLFLIELGYKFTGIDLAKNEKYAGSAPFIIEHEDDAVIIGTKLMAEALDNIKDRSIKPHNIIMRCDFSPLANETVSPHTLYIHDFARSLPQGIANFLIRIDDRLQEIGCIVEGKKDNFSTDTTFVYFIKHKKKVEVCRLFISIQGCSVKYNNKIYLLNEKTDFELLQEQIEAELAAI